jgi:hypothetical protein
MMPGKGIDRSGTARKIISKVLIDCIPGKGIDRSGTARKIISKVKEKIKSKAAKVLNKIATRI